MKYAKLHKSVPADVMPLVAFFEQCHNVDQVSRVLDKLKKGKKKVNQDTACKKALNRETKVARRMHTIMLVEAHDSIIMTANIMIASDMMNINMTVIIIAKTSILINMTRIVIMARFLMEISTIMKRIARKKIMRCM